MDFFSTCIGLCMQLNGENYTLRHFVSCFFGYLYLPAGNSMKLWQEGLLGNSSIITTKFFTISFICSEQEAPFK